MQCYNITCYLILYLEALSGGADEHELVVLRLLQLELPPGAATLGALASLDDLVVVPGPRGAPAPAEAELHREGLRSRHACMPQDCCHWFVVSFVLCVFIV